jgi:S-adenosylmethionine:tRNA-ribosyltransferase-isomerase (queuine synthetase)
LTRLLLDEHISPALVRKLGEKGLYAEAVAHVGLSGKRTVVALHVNAFAVILRPEPKTEQTRQAKSVQSAIGGTPSRIGTTIKHNRHLARSCRMTGCRIHPQFRVRETKASLTRILLPNSCLRARNGRSTLFSVTEDMG